MQPHLFLAGLVALLTFPILATRAPAEASWRFVNLPDWHGAEKYVSVWTSAWSGQYASYEAYRAAMQAADRSEVQNIYNTFGGDLLIMPGDTQNGHWDEAGFVNSFTSVPQYASLTAPQVVVEAAHLCYSGMKTPFNEGGYPIMFVAVGDHEIGDNNWRANDPVAPLVPSFRQGFADIWNEDSTGAPLYNTPIGTAPARPLGTPYEETSYAVRHKNALFITVDIFRQDSPTVTLDSDTGTVIGSMTGDHLAWFNNVLAQAKTIPSIKHVFVQAHLPTIYPVRKFASSGMLVTGTTSSSFIQAMRDGGVDIYFGGEVHLNTVTVDDQSDLVQVVARGNRLSNVTTVDVEDDRISLALHHMASSTGIGTLVIDKSGPQTTISGTGQFKPIHPGGLQGHYSFDQLEAKADILTSADNEGGKINGTACPNVFRNLGGFGDDYVAYADQCTLVAGKVGQAVALTPSSIVGLNTMGPIQEDYQRTVSCWFRTTATNRQILFNCTPKWGSGQVFNLSLNAGKLELILSSSAAKTANGTLLNDGQWHHVAAVVPQTPCTLAQARLYIDGILQTNLTHSGGTTVIDTTQSNVMAFGTIRSDVNFNLATTFGMSGFTGTLDEMGVWTRALTDAGVRALAAAPAACGYDASAMEKLFLLADAGAGSVEVNGDTWIFDPALTGTAGVFETSGTTMTLVLGPGGGLRTTIQPDTTPPTPNPAGFQKAAVVTVTSATLEASPGSDLSGPVEYLFTETSGNFGGTSMGWQTSSTYTDTGLLPETLYRYTITLRDGLGNTGTASTPLEVFTPGASLRQGVLIAWHTPDATAQDTACNDSTPDLNLAGVTGTLSGGRDASSLFNSTDLSYGALATPAAPPGANAVRVRTVNSGNVVTLSLTNQTGGNLDLGKLHFDFGGHDNGPRDFELRYFSGDLANAANTLIASGSRPGGSGTITNYFDYDLPFSPALADTTLAHGESATFRLTFTNPASDTTASGVDNIAIHSASAPPAPDSDLDGIPDSVENASGLDSGNPGDAALDKDGDGFSNLIEHLLGTSIADPADFLSLALQRPAPGSAQIVVPRLADGRLYILEHSPALVPPWRAIDAFTAGPADAGQSHAFPIATSAPSGFFRVRVVMAP